ncbi:35271_t:CDS:2 [Racocetra persica]|uniref:35271_t:CDS:1 n=1 Tax=Racocetra persica TaxID=160502 RepID=A0ACA9KYJ2_9GLOM|nr:35271_t:CDS:2 [Racocetra persica]
MTSYNHQAAENDETNHHIENCDKSMVTAGSSNNNVKNEVDSVTTIKKDDESSITDSTIEGSSNVENEHSVNESSNNIEDNDENSVENIVVTDDEGAVGEGDDEGVVGEGEIPIDEIDAFPFCGSKFQESCIQIKIGLISALLEFQQFDDYIDYRNNPEAATSDKLQAAFPYIATLF